jgi:predicted PurR-regulated permease PerM
VALLLPAGLVAAKLADEARDQAARLRQSADGNAPTLGERFPWLGARVAWLDEHFDVRGQVRRLAEAAAGYAAAVVSATAVAAVEFLIVLFLLFYLFRDRGVLERGARGLVPLAPAETDAVFARVAVTVRATVYGRLAVSFVQGVLGGLMFWWLGLPAPVLWGTVMAVLSVVPVLGAFVVWVPAAAGLLIDGHWVKALVLAGWGAAVIGAADNVLYPLLVGKEVRLHPVPVFVAILGGLVAFGAAGVVIGPVVFAATDALLDVWRRRTAGGRPAEAGAAG